MSDVIMFVFAGRRANMELQEPFLRRILNDWLDVELHVWNLAQDPDDAEWLQGYDDNHPRITVRNELHGIEPWTAFNLVYQHYTRPEFKGKTFVKLDDDVVFIETSGFGAFLDNVASHPNYVTSAKIVNNGACTEFIPQIQVGYDRLHEELTARDGRGLKLLDVHLSADYGVMCHDVFFNNIGDILGGPPISLDTSDWLSINLIAYNYQVGCKISGKIGHRSPPLIAGRTFRPSVRIGDEGAVNTLARRVYLGMTACHLTFGPQKYDPDVLDEIRLQYAETGKKYLEAT